MKHTKNYLIKKSLVEENYKDYIFHTQRKVIRLMKYVVKCWDKRKKQTRVIDERLFNIADWIHAIKVLDELGGDFSEHQLKRFLVTNWEEENGTD